MVCSKCGTDNREGAYFCEKCGSKLLTYEAYKREAEKFGGTSRVGMQPGTDPRATTALIVTLLCSFAWLIPLFGYPVSLFGIFYTRKAAKDNLRGANIMFWICVAALVLTLANSVIAMMRVQGMI